jgi:hypothetical protein
LTLEFWITPFDYAPYEGPAGAIESKLTEGKLIGMSWAILDYDDEKAERYRGFWNLSHKTTMYGNASDLVAFRLMPVEAPLRRPLEVDWSFRVVDLVRRQVAFTAHTHGQVTKYEWDFGDGSKSGESAPLHTFAKGGEFVITLTVEGLQGRVRRAKVWDVVLP